MCPPDEPTERITSRAERCVAKTLLQLLDSVAIGDQVTESSLLRDVMSGLESFVPEVLEEVDPYWKKDSLDGVLPAVTQKIGERTVKIFGECILLASQAYEPIRVCMQVNQSGNMLNWFDCKVGFDVRKGKTRYRGHKERMAVLNSSVVDEDAIDWKYWVTYGTRED